MLRIQRILLGLLLACLCMGSVYAADISITAANVARSSGNGSVISGTAGATITAGHVVYFDTSTSKWKLAQSDGTAAESGTNGVGIALHGASDGQPLQVQVDGEITIGGTVAAGVTYYVSTTAGAFSNSVPASTQYNTFLGIGISTTKVSLRPLCAGVATT